MVRKKGKYQVSRYIGKEGKYKKNKQEIFTEIKTRKKKKIKEKILEGGERKWNSLKRIGGERIHERVCLK